MHQFAAHKAMQPAAGRSLCGAPDIRHGPASGSKAAQAALPIRPAAGPDRSCLLHGPATPQRLALRRFSAKITPRFSLVRCLYRLSIATSYALRALSVALEV